VRTALAPSSSSGQNDLTQFDQEPLPKFNGWTSTASLTDSAPCAKIHLHGELLATQANSAWLALNLKLLYSSTMADGEFLLAECPRLTF
jgi:hypothetical protein